MSCVRHNCQETAEGFALLALLGVIGIASVGLLFAVQRFVPPLADVAVRVQSNLDVVEEAARDVFSRTGAFPASIDALASVGGLRADGAWRVDPQGQGNDLSYQVTATGIRVRSRGPDRLLGTADDEVRDVGAEPLVRMRQRATLRLIRSVYLSELQGAVDAAIALGALGTSSRSALAAALNEYAAAKREWLKATTLQRATLTVRMTADAAIIDAAQTLAGWSTPSAVTGAGGLMERLGMPDSLAVDGVGRPLQVDARMGVVAAGYDGVGGTDDDM